MFKVALGAGHGINTPGKRCLKSLDPKETREWVLNDRICDYVEAQLTAYDGYELLRLDDSDDGEDNPALATRVNQANKWGADFYLSVHHNAGVNGGSGGGIVAYVYPGVGTETKAWQSELYDALIKRTGLKGNRAVPLAESNLYVLRKTTMPAVLLELGFMDSSTDVPVILTDAYAQNCAKAIVEVLVKRGGLTRKPQQATSAAEDKCVAVSLPQLKKGSEGASVRSLQQLLTAKDFNTWGIDGSFGKNTDAAVRKYQQSKGLTVDGICGKDTWTALLTC